MYVEQVPLAQTVGPLQPLPPHWPYRVWPPVAAAELVVDALEVVKVVDVVALDVVVLLAALVVEALLVLLAVVVADVLFTEDVVEELPDEPPGTMAELVTVATLLLCATLLGKPVYSVGPGMV